MFLEKALTLLHMETHLNDVSATLPGAQSGLGPLVLQCGGTGLIRLQRDELKICKKPFSLIAPHYCEVQVDQTETH